MILLSVDAHDGELRRYECAEGKKRLTHAYYHPTPPCLFPPQVIDEMRYWPPDQYKIEPPPRPTMPPCNTGIARAAAA